MSNVQLLKLDGVNHIPSRLEAGDTVLLPYQTLAISANSTGGLTVDCSQAQYFTTTLTAATTLSVSNVPASPQAFSFDLQLASGTGGYALTLPVEFSPLMNSMTQVGTAANTLTEMIATTVNGGASWSYVMAVIA